MAEEMLNSPWATGEAKDLLGALVVHESSGCPDPESCECEGKWPWVPEHVKARMPGEVYEAETGE